MSKAVPFISILGYEDKLYASIICPLCHRLVGMFRFSPEEEHIKTEFKCNETGRIVTVEIRKEKEGYRCEWSASSNKGD